MSWFIWLFCLRVVIGVSLGRYRADFTRVDLHILENVEAKRVVSIALYGRIRISVGISEEPLGVIIGIILAYLIAPPSFNF